MVPKRSTCQKRRMRFLPRMILVISYPRMWLLFPYYFFKNVVPVTPTRGSSRSDDEISNQWNMMTLSSWPASKHVMVGSLESLFTILICSFFKNEEYHSELSPYEELRFSGSGRDASFGCGCPPTGVTLRAGRQRALLQEVKFAARLLKSSDLRSAALIRLGRRIP